MKRDDKNKEGSQIYAKIVKNGFDDLDEIKNRIDENKETAL